MSFLLLTRSFNQPISQVSNQINAIVMALAGAERIFELMDAEPEEDDGYVTLVNVRRKADGSLEERRSTPASGPGNTPTRQRAPSPIRS